MNEHFRSLHQAPWCGTALQSYVLSCLCRLSGRAFLLPFLAIFLFVLPILSLVHLGTCLACVSRHRGGSAVPLCVGRTPHHLQRAESVAYSRSSISILLAFRGGAPRHGKTPQHRASAVCSLGHRRRHYPLRYCCVGGFPRHDQPRSGGGRGWAEGVQKSRFLDIQ